MRPSGDNTLSAAEVAGVVTKISAATPKTNFMVLIMVKNH